ncbi:MAG: FtsX-like permease family protein [Candidatus Levybacteria bacterium]|nr:FtsX-like permease family protein [Candidatus Levybacteria bacterium]
MSSFISSSILSSKIISYFESRPQVTVFFRDEATDPQIDKIKKDVIATGKVSDVKFVSKQEALEIYKEQNKDDPLLLDLVTAEILPSSLEISTVELEDLSQISAMFKDSPIVQEVIFQKDVVSTLTSWTSALRKLGLAVIVLLSFVSVFIMITIIGIKISQKRADIEIMRLIGANNWYIRWPFIFEGVFYGVIGALVGWMISVGTLLYVTPTLSSFLRGIPLFPISPVLLIALLGIEIFLAMLLGVFSSYLAVLRYLK